MLGIKGINSATNCIECKQIECKGRRWMPKQIGRMNSDNIKQVSLNGNEINLATTQDVEFAISGL